MEERKKQKWGLSVLRDSSFLIIGEAIISAAVIGVYLLIQFFMTDAVIFTYKVITGAVLGSIVTLANYLVLSISVNRAVDKYMEKRGTEEMDDEQAYEFAQKNAMAVQNAATRSYMIRMLTMTATLVLAFILEWFDPIATAIPLLMFRPILFVTEFIKGKKK